MSYFTLFLQIYSEVVRPIIADLPSFLESSLPGKIRHAHVITELSNLKQKISEQGLSYVTELRDIWVEGTHTNHSYATTNYFIHSLMASYNIIFDNYFVYFT